MRRLFAAAFATSGLAAILLVALAPQVRAAVVTLGTLPGYIAQAFLVSRLPSTEPTDGQVATYEADTDQIIYATPAAGAGDIEGVTAGAGLTGGGTTGTVTCDVGAGTNITVNANDVALDTSGSTIALTGSFALTGGGTRVTEGYRRRVYTYTGSAGAATTLTHSQSGSIVTNTGAGAGLPTYVTLPLLDGAEDVGLEFEMVCDDADGIRFTANTGDTITVGSVVGSSAGYVQSVTIGCRIRFTAISTSQWVCTAPTAAYTQS